MRFAEATTCPHQDTEKAKVWEEGFLAGVQDARKAIAVAQGTAVELIESLIQQSDQAMEELKEGDNG